MWITKEEKLARFSLKNKFFNLNLMLILILNKNLFLNFYKNRALIFN